MRREKLEKELAQDAIAEAGDEEGVKDASVTSIEDKRRQPKERHRRSTLRILNSNAGPSSTSSGAISDAGSSLTDDEKTPTTVITDGEKDVTSGRQEQRASEAEVEARLLKTLMPLLQNMQSTLNEMQRDSASKELSNKFMESALAVTNMKQLAEKDEGEREERKSTLESPS